MNNFTRSLITEWRRLGLPVDGKTIVVAVSGGADSVSLLLGIDELRRRKKLKVRTIVAHLNHKLRGRESDADEKFVKTIAEKLGYEFVSSSAKIAGTGNLEQNARNARYKFLTKTANDVSAVAVLTGHTQNDQAETFLLNLIRGSGPDGLSAIEAVRELGDGVLLVRPLLWATRKDTENFCRENGVKYRSDRMNRDEAFTRVKIRRSVIPLLAELNPRIVETLARTAVLMRRGDGEKVRRGNRETRSRGDGEARGTAELTLAELKPLPQRALYDALRAWLRGARGNLRGLSSKHIEAIERLILSPKSGKTVELPGGGRVIKSGGQLRFENIKVEK